MVWIVCIIVIVVFVIYKITSEHRESVNDTVTRYGGMRKKYKTLITYLENGGCTITKVTSDGIILSAASAGWTIDVVGNEVEIRIEAMLPMFAKFKKKWVYPHNYPQENMIREIDNDLSQEVQKLMNNMKNLRGEE